MRAHCLVEKAIDQLKMILHYIKATWLSVRCIEECYEVKSSGLSRQSNLKAMVKESDACTLPPHMLHEIRKSEYFPACFLRLQSLLSNLILVVLLFFIQNTTQCNGQISTLVVNKGVSSFVNLKDTIKYGYATGIFPFSVQLTENPESVGGPRDKYLRIIRVDVRIPPVFLSDIHGMVTMPPGEQEIKPHEATLGLQVECEFIPSQVLRYCNDSKLHPQQCDWLVEDLRQVFNLYKEISWNENDRDYCEKERMIQYAREYWHSKAMKIKLNGQAGRPYDVIWNPSLTYHPNGMVIMSHRITIPGLIAMKDTMDVIGLTLWHSWDDFEAYLSGKAPQKASRRYVLQLEDPLSSLEGEVGPIRKYIVGEDMRVVVVGNELIGVFNSGLIYFKDEHNKAVTKRKICYIKIAITENTAFAFDGIHILHLNELNQKNWVPFDYHGRLFLSYSLSPHTVTEAAGNKIRPNGTMAERVALLTYSANNISRLSFNEVSVMIPSLQTKFEDHILARNETENFIWRFGDYISGGSPAVRLNNEEYIAIFHSVDNHYEYDGRNHSADVINKEARYYMGAYRFLREPPFTITGISRHPIIPRDTYLEDKFQIYSMYLDYVVYPMGLFIRAETAYISYGYNDGSGFVLPILLSDILNDMVAIEPSTLEKDSWISEVLGPHVNSRTVETQ